MAKPKREPREAASCTTVEDRVMYIAERMSEGEWLSSIVEQNQLANVWDTTRSTVRRYAAESHRLVDLDPDDRKQLRRALQGHCERILNDAVSLTNLATGLPDFKSQLEAIDKIALYAGIRPEDDGKTNMPPAPTRIEFSFATVPNDPPQPPADGCDEGVGNPHDGLSGVG